MGSYNAAVLTSCSLEYGANMLMSWFWIVWVYFGYRLVEQQDTICKTKTRKMSYSDCSVGSA